MARILPHSYNSLAALSRTSTDQQEEASHLHGAVVASRHFICLLRWIVCVGELHQGSLTSDPSLHLQAAWSAPEFIWAFRPAQMNRTVETKTGPFKLDQTALAWEECFAIFISWKGKLGSTWKYFKRQKISFVHKCLSFNYWIQDFFFIN